MEITLYILAYLVNGIGYTCTTSTVADAHGGNGMDMGDNIIWVLLWPLFALAAIVDSCARVMRGN